MPHARLPMLTRGLLVALISIAACRTSEAAPAEHAPVKLSETDAATVAGFVGTWQHAGGSAEQEAALAAVRGVTDQMNGLIRGMAESRLSETVKIDATMTIEEADGILTITRSDRAKPFRAPADGSVFDMQTEDGDDAKASLRIDGTSLVTHVETSQGGGERTYRLTETGQLEITARTFSPRLPGDVVYTARYARP